MRRLPILAALLLSAAVLACSYYGAPRANLHSEYINIAQALVRGDGFADPFGAGTGPSAWTAPALPTLLAGLLAVSGSQAIFTAVLLSLHVAVLIGTGLLLLALARATTQRVNPTLVAAVYSAGLVGHFGFCFRFPPADTWITLLALDLVLAGLCWGQPLARPLPAALWGVLGGAAALVNPIVGFAWGGLTLVCGCRQRRGSGLALALGCAALTLLPWTVRNYLLFGRLIPVKANLAFELYQSQCLQADGLLRRSTLGVHLMAPKSAARREYQELGETAFLDQKRELFWQAVHAAPLDFLERVATRFLGATLLYEPYGPNGWQEPTWLVWYNRLSHPLPLLALLLLAFTAAPEAQRRVAGSVAGVYLLYLLPYIGISYYERYALPLVGVKSLLILWAADRLLLRLPRRSPTDGRGYRDSPEPCGSDRPKLG